MRNTRALGSNRLLLTFLLVSSAALAAACSNLLNNPSTPSGSSGTDTFSGTLALNSSVVFMFKVTTAGPVSVDLSSVSPSTLGALGLGIGTSPDGTGCSVTNSTSAAVANSTAQLTVTENPGSYCVKVTDLGNLTTSSTVTVGVTHS